MIQRKGLDTLKCYEVKWTLLQGARPFSLPGLEKSVLHCLQQQKWAGDVRSYESQRQKESKKDMEKKHEKRPSEQHEGMWHLGQELQARES